MSTNWYGNPWLDTWTETSSQVVENVIAANQAAFAAWSSTDSDRTNGSSSKPEAVERIEPSEDLPEWHAESTAESPDELSVGDRFEFTKTISEEDVTNFAAASGDTNPLHLDDEFAEDTRFRGRIAHGTLVGGLISAALARVPGLVIYLSQDLEFHSPVRIGDRVTAECEIVEDLGNDQFRLTTRVTNGDDIAIDGEAVIMVDDA